MTERYFGKVVNVPDRYSVVINAGESGGVKVGMRFLVIGLGELISDPDTGEELERLEVVRGRAEVVHVQGRLSTLKSIEFERQPGTREIKKVSSGAKGLASLIGPQDVVTEFITPAEPVLLALNGAVVGDFVIKLD